MTIEPEARAWRGLVMDRWERARSDAAAMKFRAELGLPTDRPVVMSGHQAMFWHPGILAKYLAAGAAARGIGAQSAWVVVDQDEQEFTPVRVPVRDEHGKLSAAEWSLTGDTMPVAAAVGSLGAFEVKEFASEAALPSAAAGVRAIAAALHRAASEANAGRQVMGAVSELLCDVAAAPTLVYASAMARTALFSEAVARMRAEPDRASSAYNAAVRSFPEAGLTELRAEPQRGRWELPLWKLEPGKARQRVFTDTPGADSMELLAPRALLMTGLLRMAACDVFIHGTGGAVYDRATEVWLREWLGVELAPVAMVTADLLLPLHEGEVSTKNVADAVWRAHRARHDPALLGLNDLAAKKLELVAEIARTREEGADALPGYRRLHELLARYRDDERAGLAAMSAEARRLQGMMAEARVARDRTWAFPLHSREALGELAAQVERAFGVK